MLDVEISLRLAMAIGWPYTDVNIVDGAVRVPWPSAKSNTRVFDYRDKKVIWAIAEAYDAFPMKSFTKDRFLGNWCALMGTNEKLIRYAETSEKAVAMCVIAHHEYQKRLARRRGARKDASILSRHSKG